MSVSQRIAAWHAEWVKTAKYTVDPSYLEANPKSAYPELIQDVTPTPESDAVYWAGVKKILDEERGKTP